MSLAASLGAGSCKLVLESGAWRLPTNPYSPVFRFPTVSFMTRAKNRDRFEESRESTAGGRAQPRPAFGLRPWFALLRRARSLRRFAFAIVRKSVPGGGSYRPRMPVVIAAVSWRSPPVTVATSFVDRVAGMRRSGINGILLRSSSVHAAGLPNPLRIVHVDAEGTVLHQDVLTPGRRVAARGMWILELPIGVQGPDTGAKLTVLPSSRS